MGAKEESKLLLDFDLSQKLTNPRDTRWAIQSVIDDDITESKRH
jgi:hypothetical protein